MGDDALVDNDQSPDHDRDPSMGWLHVRGSNVTLTRAGTRARNYGEGARGLSQCGIHLCGARRTPGEMFRSNAGSPTVLTASREKYADVFPGFPLVDDDAVGRAFVRSVESKETGRVYEP